MSLCWNLEIFKNRLQARKNVQFTFGESGLIPKISFPAHKVPYVTALGSMFLFFHTLCIWKITNCIKEKSFGVSILNFNMFQREDSYVHLFIPSFFKQISIHSFSEVFFPLILFCIYFPLLNFFVCFNYFF